MQQKPVSGMKPKPRQRVVRKIVRKASAKGKRLGQHGKRMLQRRQGG